MPITIVVGGQYGSEGKGKVAHWFGKAQDARYAVRVGGCNSGHTVVGPQGTIVLRHLPTPCIEQDVIAVIPAGAYINAGVLLHELRLLALPAERSKIHPQAVIIDDWMSRAEHADGLVRRIASTGQGVGTAVATRVLRNGRVRFARDASELRPYVCPEVPRLLSRALNAGARVLVEGTQGFGLSVLHSPDYPYCTSRDTTAAGALAEAGLSPLDVDQIVLVIRAFPIRVGGDSGPLPQETTWPEVAREAGTSEDLAERTTVTGRVRRVGMFDPAIVRQAIHANHPTHVFLNHVDYFDYRVHGKPDVSEAVRRRVTAIERQIAVRVKSIDTGPGTRLPRPVAGWRDAHAA